MTKPPVHIYRAFRPELRETDLPAGVIGQVAGIALVYDVIDTHGSTFVRGSLDRTIRERVASGKVKLFWDHGDSPQTGMYDSDLHIGTVRSLTDVQLDDGNWGAYMVADLLDTPKAREAKQYVQSVLASGGETGLSVGGLAKGVKSTMERINGDLVERITEFPLSEISITAMQAVPDSEVLAVRQTASETVTTSNGGGTEIRTKVFVSLDPPPEPEPEPEPQPEEDPVIAPVATIVRQDAEAAFVALLHVLPHALVRAHVRAVLGDAEPEDSSADGAPPRAASDAPAQDSRTAEEVPPPVVFATMEDRIRALRHSYAEAPYPHGTSTQEQGSQRAPCEGR